MLDSFYIYSKTRYRGEQTVYSNIKYEKITISKEFKEEEEEEDEELLSVR